jgi:hypothetical protein
VSRLYDRLMTLGSTVPGRGRGFAMDWEALEAAAVIDANNVCQYYFEGTGQEEWDVHDFPNLAPPFEDYWVEMRAPRKIVSDVHGTRPWEPDAPSGWGVWVHAQDVREVQDLQEEDMVARLSQQRKGLDALCGDRLRLLVSEWNATGKQADVWDLARERYGEQEAANLKALAMLYRAEGIQKVGDLSLKDQLKTAEFRWSVDYTLFLENEKGRIRGPLITWKLLLDEFGRALKETEGMINVYVPDLDFEECNLLNESLSKFAHPAMLATSFMHCNNVALDLNEPVEKVSARHLRRRGRPLTCYYTLEIDPLRKTLRQEGGAEKTGLKRALHICRGHFKTYTEEKPLFGKRTGTYWWPQTVRGSKARGEVVKDYAVKGPA